MVKRIRIPDFSPNAFLQNRSILAIYVFAHAWDAKEEYSLVQSALDHYNNPAYRKTEYQELLLIRFFKAMNVPFPFV